VLDEHFMGQWESWGGQYGRSRRRAKGLANYRLVRYADDFVVMLTGTREHVEALRDEVAAVLAPMGMRLSDEKTVITHVDQGFDFLGHADLRVMPISAEVSLRGAAMGLLMSA
jgi:RNA-directed DNA polymerase